MGGYLAVHVPVKGDDGLHSVVFFNKRDLLKGIVAHEMVHAALNNPVIRKRKKVPEEDVATIVEVLVDEFWGKIEDEC